MGKVNQLPVESAPAATDYTITDSGAGTTTKRTLWSSIATLLFNQITIPSGGGSPVTHEDEGHFDYVVSGLVWSGDAYASTKNASLTAGIVYINGLRISIGVVTARVFTASKDTYIDILSAGDGTGSLVYTEVANNAASPALAANSIRIGIIITGASNILSAASVNQGQETMLLPIASSIPYSVADSLGNLICPRDPNRKLLNFKFNTVGFTTTSATAVQVTALSMPVIVPTGRKVRIRFSVYNAANSGAGGSAYVTIWDGVVASGTQIGGTTLTSPSGGQGWGLPAEAVITPSTSSKTYNIGAAAPASGTTSLATATGFPMFASVELI